MRDHAALFRAIRQTRKADIVCAFGGSQPAGNTTTTQTNTPWSGEEPYLTSIYSQASDLNNSTPPQYFPGNTYAPLTDQQKGLMSSVIGYGSQGGGAALNSANGAVSGILAPGGASNVLNSEMRPGFLDPANSPYYRTAVGNAVATALPMANASFVNGNRSDSGLAQRASTSAAVDAAAGLAQNQYNTNQGLQQNAAAIQQGNQVKAAIAAPVIDQQQLSDMATGLSTAGMSQSDIQNQINADVARYNYGQMLPWNQLGLYEGAVTGTGNPGGTSTTTQPYFSNPTANVMSGLSGLGSLGMLAFTAFSDRRLKTDIHKIGESDSGFPLYAFRYKGEPPMSMHIGLMAQDVEKERPEAVLHTPRGMMVDYLRALA
jgi:hypothetical protein